MVNFLCTKLTLLGILPCNLKKKFTHTSAAQNGNIMFSVHKTVFFLCSIVQPGVWPDVWPDVWPGVSCCSYIDFTELFHNAAIGIILTGVGVI